jgi:hypothetical protein
LEFAVFCKSFRRDLERCARLYESFERYAEPALRFVLSVPEADRALFTERLGRGRVDVTTDEQILGRRLRQSWRTQQIVKLQAFRLAFADAWLVVDSDFAFIRPFGKSDFVRDDGAVALAASRFLHLFDQHGDRVLRYLEGKHDPETLSTEQARALAPRSKQARRIPWGYRIVDAIQKSSLESRLARIRNLFQRSGPELHYLPSPIWTTDSLASLEREFLRPRGLGFEDLIRYSPWEGTWVGEWEIFRGLPGRFVAESFFLHFASDAAIERARTAGVTTADFAKRYVGLALAAGHQQIEAY